MIRSLRPLGIKIIGLLLVLMTLCPAAFGETVKVKISFAGDCTLGADRKWYQSTRSFVRVIEKEGMEYPFSLVKELFETDDLTMVNLEGVFKDNTNDRRKNVMHNFYAPTSFAQILPLGNVELVTLANNHTLDYGKKGLAATKEALAANQVGYCIDQDVFYFEKDGVKIAFLGFQRYSYRTHRTWIAETLSALKEGDVDFIIVNLHAGNEYSTLNSPITQEIAYELIDLGADLIVCHHPHVLQGIEIYNERPILYSIGNFSFGGNQSLKIKSLKTVVVQAEVEFDEQGYLSQQLTLFPAHSSGTTEYNDYRPLLVTGEEADAVIAEIQKGTDFPLNPYKEGKGAVQEKIFAPR